MTTLTTTPEYTLDRLRTFADTSIWPRVESYTQAHDMPRDILEGLADLGLFAPFLTPEYGGLGWQHGPFGDAHALLAQACSSARSILTAHAMVAWAVNQYGTPGQKSRYLRELGTGSALAAFCLTGSASGSASDTSDTHARREGGDWVIDGTKLWTTNAQRMDLALLFADTDEGMTAFLVDRDLPGVHVNPITDVDAVRANLLGEVIFDAVRVPQDAVLLEPGAAKQWIMTTTLATIGRPSVANGARGIIRTCLALAAHQAVNRSVNGARLADHDLVKAAITELTAARDEADLHCAHVAHLLDTGTPGAIHAAWMAKLRVTQRASEAVRLAQRLHGARGFSHALPFWRMIGDAFASEVIEGSTETNLVMLAAPALRTAGRTIR